MSAMYASSSEYEWVVREIVASIYKVVEGISATQVNHGLTNRWIGGSGYEHQIDVSLEGPTHVILIECKDWGKNVSTEAILAFIARIIDIQEVLRKNIHPVLAMTSNPDPGVKQLASHFKIDLQIMRSPEEFGFQYKNLLLVVPKRISATLSTSGPQVVISDSRKQNNTNESD